MARISMKAKKQINNYEDIIQLPHYQSKTRPKMAREKRAAQFAPFLALPEYSEKKKSILEDSTEILINKWEDIGIC